MYSAILNHMMLIILSGHVGKVSSKTNCVTSLIVNLQQTVTPRDWPSDSHSFVGKEKNLSVNFSRKAFPILRA